MDSLRNPFSPGAGTPPPELVGRDTLLQDARVLFGRTLLKKPERSLLMVGLRGVGKTVLLNEMQHLAQEQGYRTIYIEAQAGQSFITALAPKLRQLLFDLNRLAGATDTLRKSLAVLRSFMGAIKIAYGDFELGLDIEPEKGVADSGNLELDLPELFTVVAQAAEERKTAIAIFIDEVQYLKPIELSAMITAMHAMQQKQLPLVLIGAGLPILLGMAGDSKSYSERLFVFPQIGALSEEDAFKALQDPMTDCRESFSPEALKEIYRLTCGYPYFLQEWGYQAWNHAAGSPISLRDIQEATAKVTKRLDDNFFSVRFNRLTHGEKRFLRAMAELGTGPYRTSDIAETLGVKLQSLGPVRQSLIKKGMIYSPSHGEMAFTVPLFDEFMRRVMPEFQPRVSP